MQNCSKTTSDPRLKRDGQRYDRGAIVTQGSAQGVLQFTHGLPLPVVVIRRGPLIDIIKTVKSIESERAPKLVTTDLGQLGFSFSIEVIEPTLQIFDLSDGHRLTHHGEARLASHQYI